MSSPASLDSPRLALVLGAGGMVGAHVVRALLERGWRVRALLRSGFARPGLEGLSIEVVAGDLEDRASLDGAMYGVDAVVHCAGYYVKRSLGEMRQMARALVQTRNVLGAARDARVARLVYTSSVATIGPPRSGDALADERCTLAPGQPLHGLYQRVKVAMEHEVMKAAQDGLPVVVLNPTFAVGEYDMRPQKLALLARVAQGELPFLVEAQANWVDARDVGRGHLWALERGRIGSRYILGGENLTFLEVCTRVVRRTGVALPRLTLPMSLALGLAWTSEIAGTFVRRSPDALPLPVVTLHELGSASYVDCTLAAKELGYQPRAIDDALDRSLAWYRKLGFLPSSAG